MDFLNFGIDLATDQGTADFRTFIFNAFNEFCLNYEIDKNKIQLQQYNYFLAEIGKQCFNTDYFYNYNNKLKSIDFNKLNNLYNIYISISNLYAIEVSMYSFCQLCNISIIKLKNYIKGDTVTPAALEFLEKTKMDNEMSLDSLLTSNRCNPLAVITKLNHRHGWSEKTEQTETQKQTYTLESVEQLLGLPNTTDGI